MKKERTLAVILLAAGESRRYGGIKLLDNIQGKKMYQYAMEILKEAKAEEKVVVTGYQEVRETADKLGMQVVWNDQPAFGISLSLKLGLKKVLEHRPEIDGVLFLVCDQPYLSVDTVNGMLQCFRQGEMNILCSVPAGGTLEEAGNPCIISKHYFEELFLLEGDVGGKRVIRRHLEDAEPFFISRKRELLDIDTKIFIQPKKN
ncbi:nucleotidyltransferase family protein [Acetivibrio ethanolgignens]|uniref:MobA-like NTP transferase domain-containing protein n=1 Tax=Acetivibrio ethanolgignens TaxID=290052 RepID=A0A0V8QFQ0_9FIRM|nr:nucleotidyltransferase family protein [Acetivibrio ethanolgignens]KSV59432.1 hypothetical protein ASU35_08880 [Acetivibrio ethanolgignens]